MQTDIFLYNQCRPLPILQCDAAIPQIFRMVINTIRDTNDFQRFQCLNGYGKSCGIHVQFSRQGDHFT